MTDAVVPVFIPYARFLEVRARRLAIDTDVTPPDEHPTNVAVSSAPIADDESSAGAVVRVLTTAKVDGEQQIGVQIVAGRPSSRARDRVLFNPDVSRQHVREEPVRECRSRVKVSDHILLFNDLHAGGAHRRRRRHSLTLAGETSFTEEMTGIDDGDHGRLSCVGQD
jgi:hypothetical protein